jgi:DNA polymerase-1
VPYKTKGREHEFKCVSKEKYHLDEARKRLGLKKEDGYHLLPREVLIPYALKDTEFTLLLFEKLMPRLKKLGDARLLELYAEFMELKRVLLDMEADGFALDLPYLDRITSEYGVKVMEGWDHIVKLTGQPDLNPQSPKQLTAVFEEMGLPVESTSESYLQEIVNLSPLEKPRELAEALLQYRGDKKIHTTYLTALQKEQRDGIVHPNFNDDAARTGRMSSSAASNN